METQWQTLRTEDEYRRALARLDEVFNTPLGAPESDEYDLLCDLVEAYENIHYPIPDPPPLAVIELRMEEGLLTMDDLAQCAGGRERAAAILAGREEINPEMAEALYTRFDIDIRDLLPAVAKP